MAVAYVRNISYSRKLLIHLVLVEILFDLLLLLMCCEENRLWYRSLFGIRTLVSPFFNNEIMKTHADRFLPHVYTQLPKYYGYLKTVSHVVGAKLVVWHFSLLHYTDKILDFSCFLA